MTSTSHLHSMCRENDANDCCGCLVYMEQCRKCRTLANVARVVTRLLGKQANVRFRAMTPAERATHRKPIFEGDDGDLVTGTWPCAYRLLLELTRTRWSKKILHGTRRVPRSWLNAKNAHCYVCKCIMGHCCHYCDAGQPINPDDAAYPDESQSSYPARSSKQ